MKPILGFFFVLVGSSLVWFPVPTCGSYFSDTSKNHVQACSRRSIIFRQSTDYKQYGALIKTLEYKPRLHNGENAVCCLVHLARHMDTCWDHSQRNDESDCMEPQDFILITCLTDKVSFSNIF